MTGQNLESYAAVGEIVHGIYEMPQATTEPIKFPDHQSITFTQRFERSIQAGPVVKAARTKVFVDVRVANTSGDQSIALKICVLRPVCFGNSHITD